MGSLGGGGSSSKSTSTSTSTVPRAPASPQEKELQRLADEYYKEYDFYFKPVNAELLDRITTDPERDALPAAGRAGVDARLALDGQSEAALQRQLGQGARVGTGRGLMAAGDAYRAEGSAVGGAQGGAYRGAYDQEFTGRQKLAAQGRGLQDDSRLSTTEAGNRATQAAVAQAGRNTTSSGTSTQPGPPNPYAGTIASAMGAAASGLTNYLFSPLPSSIPTAGGWVPSAGGFVDNMGMTVNLPGSVTPSSGGFMSGVGDFFSSVGTGISNFFADIF